MLEEKPELQSHATVEIKLEWNGQCNLTLTNHLTGLVETSEFKAHEDIAENILLLAILRQLGSFRWSPRLSEDK